MTDRGARCARPPGNVNHAGGCCVCARLCLARRRRREDGPVEGSQAGDLQAEQVRRSTVADFFFFNVYIFLKMKKC